MRISHQLLEEALYSSELTELTLGGKSIACWHLAVRDDRDPWLINTHGVRHRTRPIADGS